MLFINPRKRFVPLPDTVRCKSCKTVWDLPILRTRKDYEHGVCPKCGGYLTWKKFAIYENEY